MIKKNSEFSDRIVNLDFLRGFFVVLAMLEHYSYYANRWYLDYFKEFNALKTVYSSHYPMIGKVLLSDLGTNILALIFVPWVSQIYLSLACFNVAKKSSEEISHRLKDVIKYLALLLFIFYAENFFVSTDFGQAISFTPIMLWMIVLMIVNSFYAHYGVKAIWTLLGISFLRWFLPLEYLSSGFEDIIRTFVHPSFEYDARLEYFLTSGCIGFLLGYYHHHKKDWPISKMLGLVISSAVIIALYFIFTPGYQNDPSDIFKYEHECAKSFFGSIYIWSVIIFVITLFLMFERKNIKFDIKLFSWVGKNSLFIFVAHKILYLKLIMPFTNFIYANLGWHFENNYYVVISQAMIALFLCWIVLRLELLNIITRTKKAD